MRHRRSTSLVAIFLALASVFVATPADASSIDSDRDGKPNRWESSNRLNPNSAKDAKSDIDHDGLSNLDEYRLKGLPRDEDADNDGQDDGDERTTKTKVHASDTDGDGLVDGDEDSDRDGLANEDEDDATESCTDDDDDVDQDRVANEDENELKLRVGVSDSDRDGVLDGDEDSDGDHLTNEDEDDELDDRCSADLDRDGLSDEDQDDTFGTIVSYDSSTGVLVVATSRNRLTLQVGDRLKINGGVRFDCQTGNDEEGSSEGSRKDSSGESGEGSDDRSDQPPATMPVAVSADKNCALQAVAVLQPGVAVRELETEKRSGFVKEIKLSDLRVDLTRMP